MGWAVNAATGDRAERCQLTLWRRVSTLGLLRIQALRRLHSLRFISEAKTDPRTFDLVSMDPGRAVGEIIELLMDHVSADRLYWLAAQDIPLITLLMVRIRPGQHTSLTSRTEHTLWPKRCREDGILLCFCIHGKWYVRHRANPC